MKLWSWARVGFCLTGFGVLLLGACAASRSVPIQTAAEGNPGEPPPDDSRLRLDDVAVQPDTGILFGVAGMSVFTSRDEGMTWERVVSPSAAITRGCNRLRAIAFLDKKRLWTAGECRVTFRSTDAGASWELVSKGFEGKPAITKLLFYLPTEGMMVSLGDGKRKKTSPMVEAEAVDERGAHLTSFDQGHEWEDYDDEPGCCFVAAIGPTSMRAGFSLEGDWEEGVNVLQGYGDEDINSALKKPFPRGDKSHRPHGGILPSGWGWILIGDRSVYWMDLRHGSRWEVRPVDPLPEGEGVRDAVFADDGFGVLVGTADSLWVTSDRGTTWASVGRRDLEKFLLTVGTSVVATAAGGETIISSDRGRSWTAARMVAPPQ